MRKGSGILRVVTVALAIGASVAAVRFGGSAGDAGSVSVLPHPETRGAREGAALDLSAAERHGFSGEMRGDLFPGVEPPKRAPARAVPAIATRSEPTFPYKYSGWVRSGGALRVFLQRGNEFVSVGAGEMLDEAWRVDALTEERIEVSFVPSGNRLSIALATLTGEATAQGPAPASPVATLDRGAGAQAGAAGAGLQPAQRPQPVASAGPMLAGAFGLRTQGAGAAEARNQGASAGPGSSSVLPTGQLGQSAVSMGRLGVEAPTSGSMPAGSAQAGGSGSVAAGPLGTAPANPAGRLGLE